MAALGPTPTKKIILNSMIVNTALTVFINWMQLEHVTIGLVAHTVQSHKVHV